jgi:hypothetical protein
MRTRGRFGAAVLGLAAAVLLGGGGRVTAGLIVVSGDENITDALVGNTIAVNPGDQRFFSNVLGGGTRVLVQGTDVGGVDTPVANTNTFYNTLPGVTSTIQSGPVTAASLAGVNLFVSAIPASPFAPSEVSALSAFSAGGGKIFLMGDAAAFSPTQDANLNALLLGLGSTLQIIPDNLDSGFHTGTGSQIATDPLTAGVGSFTYAFVSRVSGGTPLFFTEGHSPFIEAVEPVAPPPPPPAVPEPSSLALLSLGGLALAGWRRWRKRNPA